MTIQNNSIDFTCPFCSLLCDDLKIITDGNKFSVPLKNSSCAKKIEAYNLNNLSNCVPLIKNKQSKLTDAVQKVKKVIKDHKEIIIINHGLDMVGMRSLLGFSSQYNCIIDHVNSKFLYQNISVIQKTGYMATTLMETKNRGDTIIIFGNKIFDKSPRLLERSLLAKNSLNVNKKRNIILVGNFNEKTVKSIKGKCNLINIKVNIDLIPSLLQSIGSTNDLLPKGVTRATIKKLKEIIKKSKYLVATWTASDFSTSKNPDEIISCICKYIVDINVTQRAACMPISGSLGDNTSSQVLTWLTGFPSRIKHMHNTYKHDRIAYDSNKLIDNGQADLAIHVSTLSKDVIYLNKKIKNIVLGHPNSKFTIKPDIFIPIGIPGIDYKSLMFRTDNVVSIPLEDIRNIKLPTAQSIFNQLM